MTTKHFYRRRFLNRRGMHAGEYVLATYRVVAFRRRGQLVDHSIDALLTIADCGRITTLDFDIDNERKVAGDRCRYVADSV